MRIYHNPRCAKSRSACALIERAIIVLGDKAVLARPAEKLQELLQC